MLNEIFFTDNHKQKINLNVHLCKKPVHYLGYKGVAIVNSEGQGELILRELSNS